MEEEVTRELLKVAEAAAENGWTALALMALDEAGYL